MQTVLSDESVIFPSNYRPNHVNAFRLATTLEIRELLRKPQIKSCELDLMSTCLLRKCEDVVVPIMTNMSLESGTLPADLKTIWM